MAFSSIGARAKALIEAIADLAASAGQTVATALLHAGRSAQPPICPAGCGDDHEVPPCIALNLPEPQNCINTQGSHLLISKVHGLNFKRLEQFVAVAQHGSYGLAARRLGIAQPNISRAISALESEVGAPLFVRSPQGVALTEAGNRLLPRAISILNEAEAALLEIGEPGLSNRLVRLGSSAGLVEQRLPRLLASPTLADISIEISTGTRETLATLLTAHEIEAAYCLVPELIHGSGRNMIDLQFEPTATETLAAFAAEHHPAHRKAQDLAQLAQYRWAVPLQMSVTYRFESLFFRAGVAVPRRGLASASLALLAAAARDGAMVAILPANFEAPGLARLAGDLVSFPYQAGLLTRRHQAMLPAVATVLEALRAI